MSIRICFFSLLVLSFMGQTMFGDDSKLLANIFSTGMILQRDRPIPIWGEAADQHQISVTLDGKKYNTVANQGKWLINLDALPANNKGIILSVTESSDNKDLQTVEIKDVLVGEVWLCAGQSNMAHSVGSKPPAPLKDMPQLREYVKRRIGKTKNGDQPESSGPEWMPAVGALKEEFSSTAIYFGEKLHTELNVPIGLILTAVSGTPIEEWVPQASLEQDSDTKTLIEKYKDKTFRSEIASAKKEFMKDKEKSPLSAEFINAYYLSNPGRLYNINIEPVVPYGIRGAIWYQGEANAKFASNALKYQDYLTLMIQGMRDVFLQPELPFYVVQLPSIERGKKDKFDLKYELVRQSQLKTIQHVPHTGLAVTIDINEGLHPHSKNIVGDRLANLAFHDLYGYDKITRSAPLIDKIEFNGGKAICSFKYAEKGLTLSDEQNLFTLAGKDGVFHPAQAELQGEQLILSSKEVSSPTMARYAHQGALEKASLFSKEGLPASPFSSDILY